MILSRILIEYGKAAEDVINQKVFQLLQSSMITNSELDNAEIEIADMLKGSKPKKISKS